MCISRRRNNSSSKRRWKSMDYWKKNYSGQLGNSSAVNSNEFVCINKPVLLFEETPIRIKRNRTKQKCKK